MRVRVCDRERKKKEAERDRVTETDRECVYVRVFVCVCMCLCLCACSTPFAYTSQMPLRCPTGQSVIKLGHSSGLAKLRPRGNRQYC
jgi:hypothetical protein